MYSFSLYRIYTRGKWPLGRNLDRSWWHSDTSLMVSWPQPMSPWTAATRKKNEIVLNKVYK